MNKFCFSCTAPLWEPRFQGSAENYCKHCTNEQGNLRPKEEIQKGIAGWLKDWQGDIDDQTAMERAAHFMKAMPAWAD